MPGMNEATCKGVHRRNMDGTGRWQPEPRYKPLVFYNAVKFADPEELDKIMKVDPYYITQDNGAGAPLHFATTYCRLDMVHHLLNLGAPINQRDDKGLTALHRAAFLAQHPGYIEIYELLLSGGADPSILSEDFDPYLNPGAKLPREMAVDAEVQKKLTKLEERYEGVPRAPRVHPAVGDWFTLYDYGLKEVLTWPVDYVPDYPEEVKRRRLAVEHARTKALRRVRREAAYAGQILAPLNSPVGFVFPGQGSQAVGMLRDSMHLPKVQEMLVTANNVLGYDLGKLCIEGPKEKLDDTVYSQPALLVAGLAAVEKLRAEQPGVVERCSTTAGLSLGEYSALCFAGAISFEDALKVVKVRAESMAAAAASGDPHGMLSVIGLTDSDLKDICAQVRAAMPEGTVCQVANHLFPQGRVVSGQVEALERCEKLAKDRGALKTQKLAVSGAFHSPLMASASQALQQVLQSVEIKAPRIPVYSNVTAMCFEGPDDIRTLLAQQLTHPVQWQKTLKTMLAVGKSELYELGPGKQIKAMVRRMNDAVWKNMQNVQP